MRSLRALLERLRRLLRPSAPKEEERPKAKFVSRKGLVLRSHGEVVIANWLDARGYDWEYEPKVAGYRPDFCLRRERILIEYWGMKGKRAHYDRKIVEKKRRYRKQGWTVIGVEPRHLRDLDGRLGRKLARSR